MADDKGGEDSKAKDWDRELSRHIAFLDQWRTELAPIDAKIALAIQSATSLAQTGLRSGYILNGGALIALPAFIEIFGKFEPNNTRAYTFSAIFFVLGLITCVIANFLGYKSVNTAAEAQEHARAWTELNLREQYYPSTDRMSTAKSVKLSKDTSDQLFGRAGAQSSSATRFFIGSLVLFTIGVGYVLLTWVGIDIDRVRNMIYLDSIIKLLEVLAWPTAAVVIVWILRYPILTFLGRWRRSDGWGDGGTEPTPKGQEGPVGPSAEEQLAKAEADPLPAVRALVEILRRQLDDAESKLSIDRETALLRALARSNLREHFERTYRIIWGSQIRALQALNSVIKSDQGFLKQFYQSAADRYPTVYETYSFEDWLRFLEGQALVRRDGEMAEITIEGQTFLTYLVEMRMPFDKIR